MNTAAVSIGCTKRVLAVIDPILMCYRHIQLGINRHSLLHSRWRLTFCTPGEDYAGLATEIGADGLLLGPFRDVNVARRAVARVGPAVSVCGYQRAMGLTGVPEVECDDYQVGRVGAEHFLRSRYKHFAYIDATGSTWAMERRRGFVDAVEKHGHQVDVFQQAWASFSIADGTGRQCARLIDWLTRRPKPLALFVCNDLRGREVVQACRDANLSVPDDIAMLGVDDDEQCCALSDPPLSSVAVPWQLMGYRAAALLSRVMAGEPVPPELHLIPPTVVVERASTGAAPVDDPEIRQAVRFIRTNAHLRIRVEDVVNAVGTITRRSLERRFRTLLGRTPQEEMRHAQFARAKLLLSGSDMPLKDVATDCGFADPDWFAKVFRDAFGDSPEAYRLRNCGGSATP